MLLSVSLSNKRDILRFNDTHTFVLQSYIKFEERSGDPARTQVLYERAVSEFPVSSDIWLNYTSYVDNKLKVFSAACLTLVPLSSFSRLFIPGA